MKRRRRSRAPWYHRIHVATWALLGMLLLASASLALRTARRAEFLGTSRPQVQVLNGTPREGLARRAAEVLRDHDLDVVSIGNADSPHYDETIVLLRRGRIGVARLVAKTLGTDAVLQQLDPTLLVDVTIVLGLDYATQGQGKRPYDAESSW